MAEKESSEPSVPAWMLTYADTVTLLMTFFVMLMSFSTPDEEEFERMRGSLTGYFGVVGSGNVGKDGLLMRRYMASSRVYRQGWENPPDYDPLRLTQENLDIRVRARGATNILNYKLTDRGFEIRIRAGDIFEWGTAQMMPGAEATLDIIADACRHLPHDFRVEATADLYVLPTAIQASPQELAVARSVAVCQYLQARAHVPTERLSVATRIESEDYIPADDPRSQINIVVLRPSRKRAA